MKYKNILGRIAVLSIISLVILTSYFAVFAVGEDDNGEEVVNDNNVVTEAPPVKTEAPIETDPQPETDPKTEPQPQTEPETDPETEATVETEQSNTATEQATNTNSARTQRPTEFEDIFLPEAVTEEDPTAVIVKPQKEKDLTYGYASWTCVIIGVLTIVVVIISNKSNYTGGAGKHRYGEGNKITGAKQRLLNDDYYTNRKYNSYNDRDTRR